jgi:hypothetical protein
MAATTETAIKRKLQNRQSRRDIEREVRISLRGGVEIEVVYGVPLSDEQRKERIAYDLFCQNPSITAKIKKETVEKETNLSKDERKQKKRRGIERSNRDVIIGILSQARVRAKVKEVPFSLKIEDLTIPEVCPVFNTPLVWTSNIADDTPSLDRLIPELGYVKGNVAFISYKANRIKSNATLPEVEAVVAWMKTKETKG